MIKSKRQLQNLIKTKQNAMSCNYTKNWKPKKMDGEIWELGISKIKPLEY